MSLIFDALRQAQGTTDGEGRGRLAYAAPAVAARTPVPPPRDRWQYPIWIWTVMTGLALGGVIWMSYPPSSKPPSPSPSVKTGPMAASAIPAGGEGVAATVQPEAAALSTSSPSEPSPPPDLAALAAQAVDGERVERAREGGPVAPLALASAREAVPTRPPRVAEANVAAPISSPEPVAVARTSPAPAENREESTAPSTTAMRTEVQVVARPVGIDVGDGFKRFLRHMQLKQHAEARQVADLITQAMGPQHVMSLRVQAYLALAQGELADAQEHYAQLQAAFPDDREAGFNLAVIDWRMGNKAAATRRAQALMQQYPDDVEVRAFYLSIRSS